MNTTTKLINRVIFSLIFLILPIHVFSGSLLINHIEITTYTKATLHNTVSATPTPYKIISIGNKYSESDIIQALNNTDLCGFYYSGEQRILLFDDGSIVHLKQKSDLPELAEGCFVSKSASHENEYWEIASNGHLIRRIQTLGK